MLRPEGQQYYYNIAKATVYLLKRDSRFRVCGLGLRLGMSLSPKPHHKKDHLLLLGRDGKLKFRGLV